MTPEVKPRSRLLPPGALLLSLAALFAPVHAALAQAFCASDDQPRPVQLLERFINADCESCWKDPATVKAASGQIVLDWVVPGKRGDDAPLSAVASSEGLTRLQTLKKPVPNELMSSVLPVKNVPKTTLRVAHGIALSGYVGASIELKPALPTYKGKQLTTWLALVEKVAEGTEASPVERYLVRGLLQTSWDGRKALPKTEKNRFFDSRVMSVAPGVNSEQLEVIGWVEDSRGQIVAATQSKCDAAAK